jgi:hypothetical protein
MPKFAPNTGFKMPGVGSKEIDSPSNFRDEQHVDKVGYCDTTEDSMLPQGSSPLKARYTSSGYLKDLDAISVPRASKKECPEGSVKKDGKCVPVGNTKKPPPQKVNPKGSIEVPELGDKSIEKRDIDISLSSTKPGKTVTTLGSEKGGTGVSYADKFKTLSKAKQKEFGTVENFKKAGEDYWRNKNATTKTTPGSSSSISSNPR